MNRLFIILLLSVFALSDVYGQRDTIWFNSNWLVTEKSNASFYRMSPELIKNGYLFKDYYKSGALQMKGVSLSATEEVYHGTMLWYFENGNVFQVVNYNKGALDGKRTVYFNNGSVKNNRFYDNGTINGPWESYYMNGMIKERGHYSMGEKHGIWTYYNQEGEMTERGEFSAGDKSGVWSKFHPELENEIE